LRPTLHWKLGQTAIPEPDLHHCLPKPEIGFFGALLDQSICRTMICSPTGIMHVTKSQILNSPTFGIDIKKTGKSG
jgi:hypothetical protein